MSWVRLYQDELPDMECDACGSPLKEMGRSLCPLQSPGFDPLKEELHTFWCPSCGTYVSVKKETLYGVTAWSIGRYYPATRLIPNNPEE